MDLRFFLVNLGLYFTVYSQEAEDAPSQMILIRLQQVSGSEGGQAVVTSRIRQRAFEKSRSQLYERRKRSLNAVRREKWHVRRIRRYPPSEQGSKEAEDLHFLIHPLLLNKSKIQVGNNTVSILDSNFEIDLVRAYAYVLGRLQTIEDQNTQRKASREFNQNMLTFISDVLIPARFRSFQQNKVKDNTVLHALHRDVMRRLYSDLAMENSKLVPHCWQNLYQEIDARPHKGVHLVNPPGWKKLGCKDIYETPYPDVLVNTLKADDLDLTAPTFITPTTIHIRGHAHADLNDVKHTEDILLRFYYCTQILFLRIERAKERNCFNETFNMNVRHFFSSLTTRQKKFDRIRALLQQLDAETETEEKGEGKGGSGNYTRLDDSRIQPPEIIQNYMTKNLEDAQVVFLRRIP